MKKQKIFLVVGGSSVSGQAILAGLRGADTRLISTTSTAEAVSGADHTIHGIDLAAPDAADKILAGVRAADAGDPGTLAGIVYVPARGMVGMPASAATREMVSESIEYSVRPMLRLMRDLRPALTVCLSGFITMEPMLDIYGAMTFTKLIMEDLAVRHPDRFKAIRLGMFPSKSVRGIAILVQKGAMRKTYPELVDVERRWRDSGEKKFADWLWGRNYEFEEKVHRHAAPFDKPFRPTTADDIRLAAIRIFSGEKDPILNVLGDWVWTDTKMPALPAVIQKRAELLQTDLDLYFAVSGAQQ